MPRIVADVPSADFRTTLRGVASDDNGYDSHNAASVCRNSLQPVLYTCLSLLARAKLNACEMSLLCFSIALPHDLTAPDKQRNL